MICPILSTPYKKKLCKRTRRGTVNSKKISVILCVEKYSLVLKKQRKKNMLEVDKALKDVEKLNREWFWLFLMRQAPVNDQWNHHIASLKQINRVSFSWKGKVITIILLWNVEAKHKSEFKKGLDKSPEIKVISAFK